MTILVNWDPKLPHTLHYQFSGHWTWDDFFAASEQEFALVAPLGEQRYDLIAEFPSPHLPLGPGISHVNRVNSKRKQHGGLLLVVSTSGLIHTMVSAGKRVYPVQSQNFRSVRTLIDAYAEIEHDRAKQAPAR